MKILQRPSFIVSDPLTVQHCGECNRDFAEAPGAPMLPMAHCEEELDGKNTATDCWGSCCRSCRRCSGSTNSVRRSRLHKVRGRRWKPRYRRPGNLVCDASRFSCTSAAMAAAGAGYAIYRFVNRSEGEGVVH